MPNLEAWKYFDETWPKFSRDPHNVRLGLCLVTFALFDKTIRVYSGWRVIITSYCHPERSLFSLPLYFLARPRQIGTLVTYI